MSKMAKSNENEGEWGRSNVRITKDYLINPGNPADAKTATRAVIVWRLIDTKLQRPHKHIHDCELRARARRKAVEGGKPRTKISKDALSTIFGASSTASHDSMIENLELPRILCLHGGGTNARIFRMQCRALERALSPHFRFVYVEAPLHTTPGPDVVSVYKQCGPFKAWLRIRPDEALGLDTQDILSGINASIAQAASDDDRLGATGDWVGLLGFSQGAKLAASILYAQEERQINTNFQFALLFAGRGPLVWLDPETPPTRGLAAASQATLSRCAEIGPNRLLRTPTLHVHGLSDPNIDLHRKMLRQYHDPSTAVVIEWDGGHRMPLAADCVNTIAAHVLGMASRSSMATGHNIDTPDMLHSIMIEDLISAS